jgi:hypothetical protein
MYLMQNQNTPDALQVHRANLYNMANLLALQDTISTTSGHTSDVKKLGAVDHVII